MDYTVTPTYEAMCKKAAQRIATVIRKKNEEGKMAVIGLATGSTPEGVYAELVRMHRDEGLSFKRVITFNLDEYVVDPKAHPDFYHEKGSYHQFMDEHLFNLVDIDRKNIHVPQTLVDVDRQDTQRYNAALDAKCKEYEREMEKACRENATPADLKRTDGKVGVDLQLVGIGENGHLGFCEPGSDPKGRTAVVTLDPHTIEVNMHKYDFASDKAISMGLGTISEAKEILLIANGPKKAPIIGKTLGDHLITPEMRDAQIRENPSLLLDYHPNAKAIVDMEAYRSLVSSTSSLIGNTSRSNRSPTRYDQRQGNSDLGIILRR